MNAILIWILIMTLVVVFVISGLVYYYINMKVKVRLAIIQSGKNLELLKNENQYSPLFLQLGVLSVMFSFGICTGGVISAMVDFRYNLLLFTIPVSFFLGVGLIICNSIQKRFLNRTKIRKSDYLLKENKTTDSHD